MLREIGLYGEIDKVARAMARLRLHEPPEGYYVAFSGGKDSCVVLAISAVVRASSTMRTTTSQQLIRPS